MCSRQNPIETYDPYLYDLVHRGHSGDVDFYRRACSEAKSILELGCGTGRIALELALDGLDVVGIDRHPGMLQRLEQSWRKLDLGQDNLRWICADMTEFTLNERFDRILIPFNGLFCLLDDAAVLRCFTQVARHLTDRGHLIFDVYRVDQGDDLQNDLPDEFELLTQVTDQSSVIDVFECSLVDMARQRIDAEYLYRIHAAGNGVQEVTCRIPQHYLFPEDITRLLRESGLVATAVNGGFHNELPTEDNPTIVVTAKKAGRVEKPII